MVPGLSKRALIFSSVAMRLQSTPETPPSWAWPKRSTSTSRREADTYSPRSSFNPSQTVMTTWPRPPPGPRGPPPGAAQGDGQPAGHAGVPRAVVGLHEIVVHSFGDADHAQFVVLPRRQFGQAVRGVGGGVAPRGGG